MAEVWDPPSPQTAELLREAVQWFLEHSAELAERLDEAVMSAAPAAVREDVALAREVAASNRANLLHWATCSLENPGARVPANLSPEVLAIARDAIRRGADQMLLSTYHASQNVAWRYCMQLLFSLCSDPETLREALDVAARSIFQFVDDTVVALQEQIERERGELTRGTHAERLEVVNLILEGAPITVERASARLGYDLRRRHTAAIVWGDSGTVGPGELDRAAEALAKAAGSGRPLTVIASVSSRWVWLAGSGEIDRQAAAAALARIPGMRVALGPAASGIEGFRRSHLDALATQRLMNDAPDDLSVAWFEEVELVVLAATDVDRASEFVARTLGELAHAEPVLLDTLRAYIRAQFSPTRAARALFTHRNTVLNRLQRARQLLPAPLDQRGVEVGLALELAHWLKAGRSARSNTTRQP